MKTRLDKIGVAGLAATVAVAVAMVVHLSGQTSQVTGDFRNAVTAEVRDAQGTVLLRGTFAQDGGDSATEIERKATLTSVQPSGKGAGEAEVEYATNKPDVQEVEFNVTGMPAQAVLTLVLDGKDVINATANDKGKAEAEVNVSVAARP